MPERLPVDAKISENSPVTAEGAARVKREEPKSHRPPPPIPAPSAPRPKVAEQPVRPEKVDELYQKLKSAAETFPPAPEGYVHLFRIEPENGESNNRSLAERLAAYQNTKGKSPDDIEKANKWLASGKKVAGQYGTFLDEVSVIKAVGRWFGNNWADTEYYIRDSAFGDKPIRISVVTVPTDTAATYCVANQNTINADPEFNRAAKASRNHHNEFFLPDDLAVQRKTLTTIPAAMIRGMTHEEVIAATAKLAQEMPPFEVKASNVGDAKPIAGIEHATHQATLQIRHNSRGTCR